MMSMIDQESFERMREELSAYDEERETLIKDSRKLNALSKKGMYHVHRSELQRAAAVFSEADPLAKRLIGAYRDDAKRKVGAVSAALQEWCECKAYYHYAQDGTLLGKEEAGLETEDYLLALADLTGELVRKAVSLSIEKRTPEVQAIRAFVEELYGAFLGFDFRNGELRKKTDAMRWNLQKIEELLVRQQ